ncbi:hypothetical protein ACO22_07977 [Paracoccidioides brasiliensis]|uniref:Uncharacterized protein n=1 Tax=Paracoccidioides brasiliensis TaxID=121759 RepID=A0A1D2J3J6_PARBR|nr:hypothetical protein ACO22_07977 [Paracoccidioides brasiliensis]
MKEIYSQLNPLKEVKKAIQAVNSSANVAKAENTAIASLKNEELPTQ